jgi:hypothetical protein
MQRPWFLFGFAVLAVALLYSCSEDNPTKPAKTKAPTVVTFAVSAITDTTAECGGTITSNGGVAVTARGVCWSTSTPPTTADNITTDGTGSGNFTSSLTGLTAGTHYHVRAYATNSAGTGYGGVDTFTTTAPSPKILLSSFDTNAEGWLVSGGSLYYHGTGGNPGGFIEFEDNEDQCGFFSVPNTFLGDLSEFSQGTLSFNLKNTVDNGQTMLACYGSIRISSGVLSAEKNVVPYNTYLNDWTAFSISLTAGDWGVTTTRWDSILTDVTEIIIYMDTQMNYYDRTGLDNFCFTSPVP